MPCFFKQGSNRVLHTDELLEFIGLKIDDLPNQYHITTTKCYYN